MSRAFENPNVAEPVPPASDLLNQDQTTLHDSLVSELKSYVAQNCKLLAKKYKPTDDASVYTGSAGIALLYAKVEESFGPIESSYLKEALEMLLPAIDKLKGKRISFLCGDAGPLSVAALVYKRLYDTKNSAKSLDCVLSLQTKLADPELPDELLFGRCGYLYALLFLKSHGFAIPDSFIDQVTEYVYESGRRLARKTKSPCPLMYQWHDKHYLGAAHGLAGIYFTLMLVPGFCANSERGKEIAGCLDYLLTIQFPSGNFPSSLSSIDNDTLIHWCHGAPGFVHMLLLAHKLYNKPEYLTAAVSCGEVIWARGILRKGCGLCHGTSGNGYAFVALWQATQDIKWVHRLVKFTQWVRKEHLNGFENADRPWSLFED